MKKEHLFDALNFRNYSHFFAILLLLIIGQTSVRANNNLPSIPTSIKSYAITSFLLQDDIKGIKQSFNDVTIQINNYAHVETDIWFYNQDTCYYINAYANGNEFTITIPEGQYDVNISANSLFGNRSVYLGYWQNQSYFFEFNGVYLDSNNNVITIE